MLKKYLPSQEYLKECFNYDPETGILTWKERPLHHFKDERRMKIWNTQNSKNIVSTINNGYFRCCICGIYYQVHRIVWKLMTGNDPIEFIDHINGIKNDNRFCNLREANICQNGMNRGKSINNSSGYKGVYYHKSTCKWRAIIQINCKKINIGNFDTPEEAYQAYCEAAEKYHKEFKNLG